jgi:hypothetical protein
MAGSSRALAWTLCVVCVVTLLVTHAAAEPAVASGIGEEELETLVDWQALLQVWRLLSPLSRLSLCDWHARARRVGSTSYT